MKLIMDLASSGALRAGMDDNRRDLIIRLCTQVGTIMEDPVDLALTLGGVADDHLAGRLIDAAVRRMQVLISATAALHIGA
jgi:hypothetical protein